MKTFEYKDFGETLEFAESIGWSDPYGDSDSGDWSSELADSCEQDAIDYIKSKGFTIRGYDD